MSESQKPERKTWKQTLKGWGWSAAKAGLFTLAGTVLGTLLTIAHLNPKPAVEKAVEDAAAAVGDAGPGGDFIPTHGWVKDEAAIRDNLDPLKTTQFDQTPAGRVALQAEGDVCLWRAVRKAGGFAADAYPNVNQGQVGCCVGAANKHVVDTLVAVQVVAGRGAWKPVAVEPSYALSRVEVGGGRLSGDGSVGAWIVRADRDYGVVSMEKHGGIDLTAFSPARAREWGRSGCPDALEPVAREHPVKGVAAVKSAADVERAVRQGYPVLVCSDQGFRMERDAAGRCSPQGTWMHAMSIIGVRVLDGRTQFFVLNSWGDKAHTGPRVPADAPAAGFWADAPVVDRMARQGDTHALSDAVGFPAQKLDWFIRAVPVRHRDVFARLAPLNNLEVGIAW